MPNKQTNDWELVDLIEEEIELATGIKSKTHHSGDCRMNDILAFVEKEKEKARKDERERIIDFLKDQKKKNYSSDLIIIHLESLIKEK